MSIKIITSIILCFYLQKVTSIFSTVLAGFGFVISLFEGDAILNERNGTSGNATTVLPDSDIHIGAGWLIVSLLAVTIINVLYIFLARYLLHATQEVHANN